MKKAAAILLALLFIPLVLIILIPSPIESVAWHPSISPALTGNLSPNQALSHSERLAEGLLFGPEDIAIDDAGRIYGGTQDGHSNRINTDGSVETWATTGGRPLGLHFDQQQNLIVCDAFKGLLSINQKATISTLTTSAEGIDFKFTNDIDIAKDGKIYFTDASKKWDQHQYKLDLLETKPYGRFLVYDPSTKTTTVLISDLYFANGVALSKDDSFALVNETWRYRVLRHWLKGDKAGTTEVFIDNLPGFPDGISGNDQGRFWLALMTPRLDDIDKMHPYPWLKNIAAKLPDSLKPKPIQYGFILGLNEQGKIDISLHDPSGSTLYEITSAEEHDGYLYIGTLSNNWAGRYKL